MESEQHDWALKNVKGTKEQMGAILVSIAKYQQEQRLNTQLERWDLLEVFQIMMSFAPMIFFCSL